MKKNFAMLFFTGCIMFTSCKKEPAAPLYQPSQPNVELLLSKKTISLKTGEWQTYPNFGGPGEDSMFSSWSLPLYTYSFYKPQNIIGVLIKSRSGQIFSAPPFISVSQKDSGYLYQLGETLGTPNKILLWWIQKQPLSTPDADSVFITVKF